MNILSGRISFHLRLGVVVQVGKEGADRLQGRRRRGDSMYEKYGPSRLGRYTILISEASEVRGWAYWICSNDIELKGGR